MGVLYSAGFFLGIAIGGLAITLLVLLIFRFIVNSIGKPISRNASTNIGIGFGIGMTLIPVTLFAIILDSGIQMTFLISLLMGIVAGIGAYKICKRMWVEEHAHNNTEPSDLNKES